MASVRGLKRRAAELHEMLIELGRVRSLRDPLANLDVGDLTPPQVHAMLWLGHEQRLKASTLAQRIGSSMPACTGIVDRLEKAGLVERARQEGDRRVVVIRLTAAGTKLYASLRTGFEKQLELLLGAMGDTDCDALMGIIGRLVEKLKARAVVRKETE